MKRLLALMVLVTLVGISAYADAVVLCQDSRGLVYVRFLRCDSNYDKYQFDPVALGLVGPQGPAGATGATGATGPAGTSAVYIQTRPFNWVQGLDINQRTVASVTVPAGSYVIEGRAWVHNNDGGIQEVGCALSRGQFTQRGIPGELTGELVVYGVGTVPDGPISLSCGTYDGEAWEARLVATPVMDIFRQ